MSRCNYIAGTQAAAAPACDTALRITAQPMGAGAARRQKRLMQLLGDSEANIEPAMAFITAGAKPGPPF